MAQRRASVVGLGVIGGSLALALKKADWSVRGCDVDRTHLDRALEQGVVDDAAETVCPDSDLVVVATPPSTVAHVATDVLKRVRCPVTDVASVKQSIAEAVGHPRFVPGHPMAGSELTRLEGVSASMFAGATWVLTPTDDTDEGALAEVAAVVRSLRAEVRMMDPETHDRIVAAVSHVPQLVASSLVNAAFAVGAGHERTLARVAAGSFRDMTRVAASDPAIWIDICRENREAICYVLEALIERLSQVHAIVESGETSVVQHLVDARESRQSLPERETKRLVEFIVPLSDLSMGYREIGVLATNLDVEIDDFVIHEADGERLAHLSVNETQADLLRGGMISRGWRPRLRDPLTN